MNDLHSSVSPVYGFVALTSKTFVCILVVYHNIITVNTQRVIPNKWKILFGFCKQTQGFFFFNWHLVFPFVCMMALAASYKLFSHASWDVGTLGRLLLLSVGKHLILGNEFVLNLLQAVAYSDLQGCVAQAP